MISIRKERPPDVAARETLLDEAFGDLRWRKSSQRLRDGRRPTDGLAFVAVDGQRVVGTARLWTIVCGTGLSALLLGPVAVAADCRNRGIGGALIDHALNTARRRGYRAVVLVSKKSEEDDVRWVYLDIGKFGGLAETMDESIRYPIRTPRDGDALAPCVLAGPTCDSADVLYEKEPYMLPVSLEIGDKVLIEGAGAYTATYSSVAFNGFSPLKTYHI